MIAGTVTVAVTAAELIVFPDWSLPVTTREYVWLPTEGSGLSVYVSVVRDGVAMTVEPSES